MSSSKEYKERQRKNHPAHDSRMDEAQEFLNKVFAIKVALERELDLVSVPRLNVKGTPSNSCATCLYSPGYLFNGIILLLAYP